MNVDVRAGLMGIGGGLFGVTLTYLWGDIAGTGFLILCAGILWLALYRYGFRMTMKVFLVTFLCAVAGYVWAYHFEIIRARSPICTEKTKLEVTGTVVGYRDGTSGRTPILAVDENKNRALMYSDALVSRGSVVTIAGSCQSPEAFVSDTGREVPYNRMLWARGVTAQVYANDVEVIDVKNGRFAILRALDRVREKLTHALQRNLSVGNAALAGGLFVGSREGTPDADRTAFQAAGLSHIVVLSGYNITLVARMVMIGVAPIAGFWVRRILAVLAVLLLVVLSGAEPPAVRAGLMGFLALGAAFIGRKQNAIWMFMLAVAVFVLMNPRSLLFDLSFQLSIAATIGVIFCAPLLIQKFGWVTERFGLRSLLAETLSAQLLTLPLIWYAIGTWALFGILVNLIIVPFVPLATLLAAATGIAGLISPGIGHIIGSVSSVVFSAIRGAAAFVSHLPSASLQLQALPGWVAAILFVIMCAVLVVLYRKE
jgi:ComEC/Rec2-related protein